MEYSWKNAIVMLANYHHFQAGGVTGFPCVQSRYFMWCRSGKGRVEVNGVSFAMTVGSFLFAPWRHAIRYVSDQEEPLAIGSIHVIPELPSGGTLYREIYHAPCPDSAEYRRRNNAPLPGFDVPRAGWAPENGALLSYADFVVRAFCEQAEESELRAMVPVLLHEILRACRRPEVRENGRIPLVLQETLNFIETHIEEPIGMPVLAVRSGYSAQTLFRMFRKYLQRTPGDWIYHRKMLHAAHLLTSTSLAVGEIAARVGVDDPFYFSRLFKRHLGMTAREYRRINGLAPMR